MLLAFDTATDAITVAVHDGDRVRAMFDVVDRLRHGELLATAIEACLAEADVAPGDLERIAVGVGPGPFTGLRIGLATALAMAQALSVPLLGVCTLDVVSVAVAETGPFLVATDARRHEVYWAMYDSPGRRTAGPHVGPPDSVSAALPDDLPDDPPDDLPDDLPAAGSAVRDIPCAGNGALLYPASLPRVVEPAYPRAADLATAVVAGAVELLAPVPLYLRRPDAQVPSLRRRVT
jgi:tRNA threonylcarbamoyladenosine biosynthesis protein TsaB